MSKSVYWCNNCGVPIINNNICPLCNSKCKSISTNGICNPVFVQEKKLLSCIMEEDYNSKNIWYLGNSYYLIDGKRIRLPYIEYYKNKQHLNMAALLRNDIIKDDVIPNYESYVSANERYINELIYEAENYISNLTELYSSKDIPYIPTVSFSGGKDSTVVSRLVRDALQDERIIHFFGDTTLEFPATHTYVENYFRKENPFTPMIPSETEKDFFKLCKIFGPPSKFQRWCCTIFKTSNLNNEYQNLNGNSLSFLGIRHTDAEKMLKELLGK